MHHTETGRLRGEEDREGQQDGESVPAVPAACREHPPSSLDSSLEKTILGLFLEVRRCVCGSRRVVRQDLGIRKSPSELTDARRCRLEPGKGESVVRALSVAYWRRQAPLRASVPVL